MKETFFTFFESILDIMDYAVMLCISLALMGFLWGIVRILFNADNEVVKKEGRSYMLYGVIVLFVMTSLWGLVGLLEGTLTEPDSYYIENTNPEIDPDYTGDINNQSDDVWDMIDQPENI